VRDQGEIPDAGCVGPSISDDAERRRVMEQTGVHVVPRMPFESDRAYEERLRRIREQHSSEQGT
jgi:hypothetical protein